MSGNFTFIKIYKGNEDGSVSSINCDERQLAFLKSEGWSTKPPESKEQPKKLVTPTAKKV